MNKLQEIRANQIARENNISKGFNDELNENMVLSDESFEKAIKDGIIGEVYTEDQLNLFGVHLKKGIVNNILSSDDIEKAKKDLSKLVKVTKVDKNGKKSVVWVKQGEQGGGKKPPKDTNKTTEGEESNKSKKFDTEVHKLLKSKSWGGMLSSFGLKKETWNNDDGSITIGIHHEGKEKTRHENYFDSDEDAIKRIISGIREDSGHEHNDTKDLNKTTEYRNDSTYKSTFGKIETKTQGEKETGFATYITIYPKKAKE